MKNSINLTNIPHYISDCFCFVVVNNRAVAFVKDAKKSQSIKISEQDPFPDI